MRDDLSVASDEDRRERENTQILGGDPPFFWGGNPPQFLWVNTPGFGTGRRARETQPAGLLGGCVMSPTHNRSAGDQIRSAPHAAALFL